MATFQIHEDVDQDVDENKNRHFAKINDSLEVSRKRPMAQTRSVFQTINNITHDAKRIKISEHEKLQVPGENVRVITVQNEEETCVEDNKGERQTTPESLNLDCVRLTDKKDITSSVKFENKEKESFPLDLLYNGEYKEDIWSYLKHLETVYEWANPNYMRKQKHLDAEMRSVLIDWLVAVQDEYNLGDETLHLAVNYIDRFLSKMLVVRDKFQLLGSVAMILSGKVEEIYPPDMKEWIYLSNNIYTVKQITKMEQLLLKALKFDVQPPTIASFIKFLCCEHELDEQTKHLAMYLGELALLEGRGFLHYLPSKLASSSIALARYTLSKGNPWPKKLESLVGYSLRQLSPVVQKQHKTFEDSPNKPQQTIQTKYSSPKYHKVALLRPRTLNKVLFAEE